MINKFLKKNIIINPIPKKTTKLDKETITIPEKFIKIVKYWTKEKYNEILSDSDIKQIIKETSKIFDNQYELKNKNLVYQTVCFLKDLLSQSHCPFF